MSLETLANLQSAVYSRLDGNNRMYPEAEVTRTINHGISILNLFCGWFYDSVALEASVSGRAIYRVPDSIIIPEKVTFDGTDLAKVGRTSLFKRWPDWMTETTANTGTGVQRWGCFSLDKLIINPADSIGGAEIVVTGITTPDVLENSTDSLQIPKDGVVALAEYSAHWVQCKLTGKPFTDSIQMYRSFEKYLKSQKRWQTYEHPNLWFDLKQPE